jgi:hypothetical protein
MKGGGAWGKWLHGEGTRCCCFCLKFPVHELQDILREEEERGKREERRKGRRKQEMKNYGKFSKLKICREKNK